MIVSIPVVKGANPVIPVGSPLNEALTISVVATPEALTVTAEEHAAEDMVPSVDIAVDPLTSKVMVGPELVTQTAVLLDPTTHVCPVVQEVIEEPKT